MARQVISTNFTLRLANSSKSSIVGDAKISTALTAENFYSKTYTADEVGTYLGVISDFIAVKSEAPILIQYQRVDMDAPVQILCQSLFINHGDLGKVWLVVPSGTVSVITTVWFSSNDAPVDETLYVNVRLTNSVMTKLRLRNISQNGLALPVSKGNSIYSGVSNVGQTIPVVTRQLVDKSLPAYLI